VDFRNIEQFDDIVLGSRFRSKRVKEIGKLPASIIKKIREALTGVRSLSLDEKEPILAALDAFLKSRGE
jgi:hypothetical protein